MKNFFITTPIYYINDLPHIGTAYTTIACDILSRFHKMKNDNVFFLTGTDEHGQKIERASKEKNQNPQKFVDSMFLNFKNLIPNLGCEINDFIRTTENRHKISAQHLWKKLEENGQIYLSNYEGWYSVRDESFYAENELTKINDEFLAPTGAPVEWVKEESYFFRLSEWENKLIDFYTNNPENIKPVSRYNEVLSFIRGGLKDLSISRTTFTWGIKVPGNEKHVMYVWIDALCNYLTSIDYPNINSKNFKNFWPGTHIIGKDILRFHAVYWPAFLMAAGIEPPMRVFAHGWLTNEGKKISKSVGNTINPYDIISEFGLDQFRFYLFREIPFGNDGDFSKNSLIKRVNADLSNNFGNLIQRVCSFVNKNCDQIVENKFDLKNDDKNILKSSEQKMINYKKYLNNQEIDKSIKNIFELLSETNIYIDNQAPWALKNNNIERMNVVLSVAIEIIKRSTFMMSPIIPQSCLKIFLILNIDSSKLSFDNILILPNKPHKINSSKPVFPRID